MKDIRDLLETKSLAGMEDMLADSLHKEYVMKGTDLAVLIFLARSMTLNELKRDIERSYSANTETKELLTRMKNLRDQDPCGNN